jgi:hypothetical protein
MLSLRTSSNSRFNILKLVVGMSSEKAEVTIAVDSQTVYK